jgi:hypothetical protein
LTLLFFRVFFHKSVGDGLTILFAIDQLVPVNDSNSTNMTCTWVRSFYKGKIEPDMFKSNQMKGTQ